MLKVKGTEESEADRQGLIDIVSSKLLKSDSEMATINKTSKTHPSEEERRKLEDKKNREQFKKYILNEKSKIKVDRKGTTLPQISKSKKPGKKEKFDA